MKYMNKSIVELHELLNKKEVSSQDLIKESLEMSKIVNEKCNAFVTICEDAKEVPVVESLLSGIPYGLKDNYSTKGVLSTGSSNTLKDYVPFFDATSVSNLKKAGAVYVNKTVMDEFGMGGTGTTGHTGSVKNPWNTEYMCAGSSAGSAAAVAAGVYPFATGSDTGDSIRKPAAYCGIVGYKPTYGLISRHGLFAFASSLDTLGVFTRNVEDAAIVVDAMKGIDPLDMTSYDSSEMNLYKELSTEVSTKKICYIKELCDISNYDNADKNLIEHLENFHKTLDIYRNLGITVVEETVDMKLLNAVSSVYSVISCAEATSNMSNLTGISFGPRSESENYIDMMKDYRTKGFSPLIKRRFVIGSYVLQAKNKEKYFHNAQRVRRLLVDNWKKLYDKYDAVVLPVSSGPAKKLNECSDLKDKSSLALEEHLQIGNFGGFPSITIPNGFIDNMPVGINITCNCYEDSTALNLALALESKMDYKNQIAKVSE
ncbi:MAG: amidase family protein [bacterium]